tara:strand:+ start:838 stop:3012 length:2175 start_codon:yes stop_codon:yes gene_type:complete
MALGLVAIAYLALLIAKPYWSLLLLPGFILNLDLTAWLGWSLVNELDLFLLVSLAGIMLRTLKQPATHNSSEPRRTQHRGRVPTIIFFWITVWLVSFVTQTDWQANLALRPEQVFYFSETFALFQVKGPLYALLLWALWLQLSHSDEQKATEHLLYGGMLAGLVLFGAITWERGVWQDLFSSGAYYYRLSSLLDFTSRYRVTGLLSAMHTGGEAIDGSIILLIGLVGGGIIHFTGLRKIPFILAMFGLIYCLITTFTRTTYFAGFLMFLVAGGLILKRQTFALNGNKRHIVLAVTVLIATLFSLFQLYRTSGYLGLGAGYVIITLGLVTAAFSKIKNLNRWILALGYCAAIGLGIYAQLTSKWISTEPRYVASQFALLIVFSGIAHLLGSNIKIARSTLLSVLATTVAISFLLLTTFASYRMSERLTSIGSDFQTRFDHWSDVLSSRSDSWQNHLIGMGPGAFPLAYATTHPEKVRSVGSFTLTQTGLTLGFGRDLKFAQRLPIMPHQDYQVVLSTSAEQPGNLLVGMCERNYIFASKAPFNCSSKYIKIPAVSDHRIEITLNSNRVGEGSIFYRWPTVFYVSNRNESIMTIESAQLIHNGKNLLKNPTFSEGKQWYFYNDFEHLPWHMKNIPISLLFELGIVGFLSTLLLITVALMKAFSASLNNNSLGFAGVMVVIGMISVGMMGNPLDSARISMLFYWIIIIISTLPSTKVVEQRNNRRIN